MLVKEEKEKYFPTQRPPGFDELLESLYISEAKSMIYYAYGLLGNYGLAEVAVQDTFLTSFKDPEAFLALHNPKSWLYKTLGNMIRNAIRDKQKLLLRTVALADVPEEQLSHHDSPHLLFVGSSHSDDMKLMIKFYLVGYTISELAESMGISPAACKMRLKRARERLQNSLK